MLQVTTRHFYLLAHIIMVICHFHNLFFVTVLSLLALCQQQTSTNTEYFPFPLLVSMLFCSACFMTAEVNFKLNFISEQGKLLHFYFHGHKTEQNYAT